MRTAWIMLCLATALLAQPCKPWVHGHVYDLESGSPLQGRTVQAIHTIREASTVIEAATNQAGYFEFPQLTHPGWHVSLKEPESWRSHRQVTPDCGTDIYIPNPDPKAKPCRLSLSGYVYEQGGDAMPGHVVRATNRANTIAAVANRDGHFEFLNLTPGDWWLTSDMSGFKPVGATPFLTFHADSGCLKRNLYLRRYGPREQLEETVGSIPGYAVAFYQLLKEALGSQRQR